MFFFAKSSDDPEKSKDFIKMLTKFEVRITVQDAQVCFLDISGLRIKTVFLGLLIISLLRLSCQGIDLM